MARFWSQRSEGQARNSLRQTLFALRKGLEPLRPLPLVVTGETIALDPKRVEVDVGRFEELAGTDTRDQLQQGAALSRARTLAMCGKGIDPLETRQELFRLCEQARNAKLWNALEALQRALANG